MPRRLMLALGLLLLVMWPGTAGAEHAGPLAAQWHLDAKYDAGDTVPGEVTYDTSGHDRTAYGPDGIDLEPGKFGNAISESSTGVVRASPNDVLQPQRLTVLAWVRHDGNPGTLSYIAGQGDDGGTCVSPSYALYSGTEAEDGLEFFIRREDASPLVAVSPAAGNDVWDGEWHLVAGTYDGDGVRLYVDGNEVGDGTPAPGAAIQYGLTHNDFWFGAYPPVCSSSGEFPGGLDEVRVYRRALSGTELGRLASATGPDPPVLVPDVPEPPGGEPPPGGGGEPGGAGGATDVPLPPAPQVFDVTQAAPFEPGRAAVLTAQVDGVVDSLHWNLGGDDRPEIVSTAAQSSLRFRPPPGEFKVEIRAFGPGGAGPVLTRTLIGPPAARGTSAAVDRLIVAAAPVVVAGSRNALFRPEVGGAEGCFARGSVLRSGGLEIEGCFQPITSLDEIPPAERGILDDLARRLGMGGGLSPATLTDALGRTDAFRVIGAATVNGATLVPGEGASLIVYPQINRVVSANAQVKVGPLTLKTRKDFSIDTRLDAGAIPLGTFPRLSGLPDIGKLKLAGDVDIKLVPPDGATPAEARITVNVRLPSFLKIGGVDFHSQVKLRATARDGLVLQNLTIGPLNVKAGALDVIGFQVSHDGGDEWRGQGKACIVKGACLDMIPPNGGVTIKDGGLGSLGATLVFPPPGIPLFAGVNLDQIGFRFGLDPTRLSGNARITAVKVYAIDGRLLMAFPSEAAPFVFSREDVGPGFPAGFYGRRHTRPTVAASAAASLKVPVLGDVRLGESYFLYEFPGYVAFGGATHQSFAGVVSMEGSLFGELNVENGRFNIGGRVSACLVSILCRGGSGLVSSRGLSACLEVGPFNIGGGVIYNPFDIKIWPLDGCKWSPFAERNVRGRAAQAGAPYTVEIADGDASRAIELAGIDAAPRVRVTGPDGKVVESPPESGFVNDGAIRIVRSEPTSLTVVGLQDPPPGTYRIEPLEGSPPIATISEAQDQPAAEATASVRRRGTRYLLDYDVAPRVAQSVTFTEVGDDGGSRVIGTVAGGDGTLPFSPAPGNGRRRIEAAFELDGLPAEKLVVARFSPPSPTLGKVRQLRIRRRGTTLRATWRRVAGATTYEVVTTPSNGSARMVSTRAARATFADIARSAEGRVSVRAVAELREGRPAVGRFRRTARRPSRLNPLARCRGTASNVCAR